MSLDEFERLIFGAAAQIPAAPLVQPENDLKPDPALLRHRLDMLQARLELLEQWAKTSGLAPK